MAARQSGGCRRCPRYHPQASAAITAWEAARGGSRVSIEDGAVRISGAGWARSKAVILDAEIDLEFRMLDAKAEGGVTVRALPQLPDGWPQAGYRVDLRASPSSKRPNGAIALGDMPQRGK